MIAMSAVVGGWPGGSALLQPCQDVLDELPCRSSYACRAVWSAAAMLPRQPCSRSGADCSGLPCRYVPLMMAMTERRPAACPTACWCR